MSLKTLKRDLLYLREDISVAKDYLDQIISDFKGFKASGKDIHWDIECAEYIKNIPKFKFLKELELQISNCIWDIRNGEISIETAIMFFYDLRDQVDELSEVFNNKN